jgi:hypothetical protein
MNCELLRHINVCNDHDVHAVCVWFVSITLRRKFVFAVHTSVPWYKRNYLHDLQYLFPLVTANHCSCHRKKYVICFKRFWYIITIRERHKLIPVHSFLKSPPSNPIRTESDIIQHHNGYQVCRLLQIFQRYLNLCAVLLGKIDSTCSEDLCCV